MIHFNNDRPIDHSRGSTLHDDSAGRCGQFAMHGQITTAVRR